MKNPICPLCGNVEHEYCFSENGHQLLTCKHCDLFFIHPYPDESAAHERVAKGRLGNPARVEADRQYRGSRYGYDRYFPFIDKECVDAKSLLDVGCGTGRLLELLGKKPGIHRVGIELDPDRAEYARRVAGCEICQVPLEEFEYPSKFDVITMINVLSHIPGFDAPFSSIRSLLTDGGKLILKTGELNRGVRKGAIPNWGIPEHLHVLGMSTIRFIASRHGYRIVRHEREPLSVRLFSPSKWKAPGRNAAEHFVKRTVAMTPFALSILRRLYDARYGKKAYSSFIVMSPV